MSMMHEHTKQIMLHAQIDLAMLMRYLLGLSDTYNIEAAQDTLEELRLYTGDDAGLDLMHRDLDID